MTAFTRSNPMSRAIVFFLQVETPLMLHPIPKNGDWDAGG